MSEKKKMEAWDTFVYGERSAPVVDAIRDALSDGEWWQHADLFEVGDAANTGDILPKTIDNIIYQLVAHELVWPKGKKGAQRYQLSKWAMHLNEIAETVN